MVHILPAGPLRPHRSVVTYSCTSPGSFVLEVYGSLTSFHMGVAMGIASSVLVGLAAASLIPASGGMASAVVALVQAFSYAVPRVLNEFVVLSHGFEPIPNSTFLWVYVVAVSVFLVGALLQKSVLTRDDDWSQFRDMS